jgi:putative ABC transport system permease protein
MRKLRATWLRLGGWWGREDRERELRDELEAHFQMHIEDNVRAGMTPAAARREALLRFGSVESAKESVRSGWTVGFLETLRQDLVYAMRGLRRNPAFALTATISLALGIGASVAIFTVTDELLIRPLPYRDPGRLMMVWESNVTRLRAQHNVVSPANYRDWKAQNDVFESIGAFGEGRGVLNDGRHVEEVGVQYVTADLLPLLGAAPYRGRLITPAEDLPGMPDVVLLSYRLWQSWFGGDESAIGRSVQFAGRPATVIGVMPPGFYFRNREIDVWSAMGLDPARDYRKGAGRYLMSVARLKPRISMQQAQTEMTAIARRLEIAYPVFDKNWSVTVEPLRDSMVRSVKTSMWVLLGAVGLLLAVACANVANLLLARYNSRRREIAVRSAVGAGRSRVIRQLLTESVVLAASGGLLGILLARLAVKGLVALAPRELVSNAEIAIDLRILAVAVALSLLTGIIFGLAPALAAARTGLLSGLRENDRGSIGGHGALRRGLVAAEVALSVALLAGAGLLFRSLIGLQAVDPGLDPSNVLTFRVILPTAHYREPAKRLQFFDRALEQIRALPGVRFASASNYLPFRGMASGTYVDIGGRPKAKPGEELVSTIRTVTPGYFQSMRIPMRSGRDFTDADNTIESPYRFIISESFARKYLAGEEPLGKQISAMMQDTNPFGEIIGVVGDVKEGALDKDPTPTVYYVHSHMPTGGMIFVVRTAGDPRSLAEPARRVIRGLDGAQPVAEIVPMEDVVRETFARQRFSALLLIGFSLVSLLLAAVGIYGVLAYTVTERTREFGVRVALGADPARIVTLVLGMGARLVLGGTVVGLAGAMLLTGLLKTMLFGVGVHDAVTFAVVPLVLLSVALLAAYLPARRASRMAPVEALRTD